MKIAFNGAHYAEMKHRIPFQSICYIAIDGDAQLHSININSSGHVPFGGPTMPVPGNPPGCMPMPVPGQMPMPGQVPMPGSYTSGYGPSVGSMPMPGHSAGNIPPYASGYNNAYPGQTQHSPYLQVNN